MGPRFTELKLCVLSKMKIRLQPMLGLCSLSELIKKVLNVKQLYYWAWINKYIYNKFRDVFIHASVSDKLYQYKRPLASSSNTKIPGFNLTYEELITYWGLNKMAKFLRRDFEMHYLVKKIVLWLKYYWRLLLMFQLIVIIGLSNGLLIVKLGAGHYVNQWWLWCHMPLIGINELT